MSENFECSTVCLAQLEPRDCCGAGPLEGSGKCCFRDRRPLTWGLSDVDPAPVLAKALSGAVSSLETNSRHSLCYPSASFRGCILPA